MSLNFLKTGAASVALAKQNEILIQKRRDESGKMFRFWLKEKEDAKITFVDGAVSADGFLVPPRYYEHNLFENGEWGNYYVCPTLTNPEQGQVCPLCESGDKPSLVALFTIIDHRQYTSKKDPTKVYQNTRKLLAVKSQTMEILAKVAAKRGGLACATFDVSRVGAQNEASVGSVFDFCEKRERALLEAMFTESKVDPKTNVTTVSTIFKPADYEHEITYRTGDELRAIGKGKPITGGTLAPGGNLPAPGTGGTPDFAAQM
jgi:hypothetical protein